MSSCRRRRSNSPGSLVSHRSHTHFIEDRLKTDRHLCSLSLFSPPHYDFQCRIDLKNRETSRYERGRRLREKISTFPGGKRTVHWRP